MSNSSFVHFDEQRNHGTVSNTLRFHVSCSPCTRQERAAPPLSVHDRLTRLERLRRIVKHRFRETKWLFWLLAPFAFINALVVILPVGGALLSIPYFSLFPERHAHAFDFSGSPHQRERLVQWRSAYSRLTLAQRVYRTRKRRQRRKVQG